MGVSRDSANREYSIPSQGHLQGFPLWGPARGTTWAVGRSRRAGLHGHLAAAQAPRLTTLLLPLLSSWAKLKPLLEFGWWGRVSPAQNAPPPPSHLLFSWAPGSPVRGHSRALGVAQRVCGLVCLQRGPQTTTLDQDAIPALLLVLCVTLGLTLHFSSSVSPSIKGAAVLTPRH